MEVNKRVIELTPDLMLLTPWNILLLETDIFYERQRGE